MLVWGRTALRGQSRVENDDDWCAVNGQGEAGVVMMEFVSPVSGFLLFSVKEAIKFGPVRCLCCYGTPRGPDGGMGRVAEPVWCHHGQPRRHHPPPASPPGARAPGEHLRQHKAAPRLELDGQRSPKGSGFVLRGTAQPLTPPHTLSVRPPGSQRSPCLWAPSGGQRGTSGGPSPYPGPARLGEVCAYLLAVPCRLVSSVKLFLTLRKLAST